jgi:uncharacterized protein (DUF433 family)
MVSNLQKYISMTPEILGGTPVIAGTRIPIERVYHLVRQGYSTETLQKEYPQVDPQKIQFIISYLMEIGLDAFEKDQQIQTSS